MKCSEEIDDKATIAITHINIGQIYSGQKKFREAIVHLKISEGLAKEYGIVELSRDASQELYKIYSQTGEFKLAFDHYGNYISLRDSVNNIETQRAAITQQTLYEYDKKRIVEESKHASELKIQEQKAEADSRAQRLVIISISIVLLLVAVFSFLLYQRFQTTHRQKYLIELKEQETREQKKIIEEKQKEIVDSINYAKRIQLTLLAHDRFLQEHLPDHFVYYHPKDIVSGDFYWAAKREEKFFLAVCDSTGHGVPGAFMSLLSIGFLSEAINERGILQPNEVFDFVREKLKATVSREGHSDGFDGVLFCIDLPTKQISYAAANNHPVLVHVADGADQCKIIKLPADRMPVGKSERIMPFSLFTLDYVAGNMLYLFTDGFADQFGGAKSKKFMYKQLYELLKDLSSKNMEEQGRSVSNAFDNWKGALDQVDDVCVFGIRI